MRCSACGATLADEVLFCPYDGTPLGSRPVRDPRVGTSVNDRYDIIERVGVGATASVYRAHHRILKRDVALKILHFTDDRRVARFAREARAASRIDHENVVSVMDFGYAEDGFFFLAMEYVSGRLLEEEIARSGAMPPTRVVHLLAQTSAAVARAHRLGIIHRDIKPENIMLCVRDGNADFVKILDFGLARPIEPSNDLPGLTTHGEVFGTPQCMAPEQWTGAPMDERTDIYALGVLGYQLLTGHLPFRGNVMELMFQHQNTTPEPPSSHVPGGTIPAAFDELVLRALAKDPSDRFPSVDAMLAHLEAVVQHLAGGRVYATHARTYVTRAPRAIELDPTQIEADTLDLADAPAMCAEVRRLLSVRRHRLGQMVGMIWAGQLPVQLQRLRPQLGGLETELEEDGRSLNALVSSMEEDAQAYRKLEANLRGRILDLNLVLSVERQIRSMDTDHSFEIDDADPTKPSTEKPWFAEVTDPGLVRAPEPELETQLRGAERRLADMEAARKRDEDVAHDQLRRAVRKFRHGLTELQRVYDQIATAAKRIVTKDARYKQIFSSFAEIDGAIASYCLALDALADRPDDTQRILG